MNQLTAGEQSIASTMYQRLAPYDELLALSREGDTALKRLNANCHIHLPPNFSAFETVAQAVETCR